MAAQLDVLSEGRFVLGMGAGWLEEEHVRYGLPFPSIGRADGSLGGGDPADAHDVAGGAGQLRGGVLLAGPGRDAPASLDAGGAADPDRGMGEKRTLRLVAEYAQEWNVINITPETYAGKVAALERHCAAVGRDPSTIRRSYDTSPMVGPTPAVMDAAPLAIRHWLAPDLPEEPEACRRVARGRGFLAGGTDEIVEFLGRLSELGVDEVQFLHILMDQDDVPEYLASEVAPQVKDL